MTKSKAASSPAAAASKEKKAFVQTPKGTATFTHLYEADQQYGKFQVTIHMDRSEAEEAFAPQLEALEEAFANFKEENPKKAKSVRLKSFLKDTEDDDVVELKATSQYQPPLFDTKGVPVQPYPKVSGGSTMFLMVEITKPSYSGSRDEISSAVYLNAVQLLSLVSYGSGKAAGSSPFGATKEGSFVAPEAPDEDDHELDDEVPQFRPTAAKGKAKAAASVDDATDY